MKTQLTPWWIYNVEYEYDDGSRDRREAIAMGDTFEAVEKGLENVLPFGAKLVEGTFCAVGPFKTYEDAFKAQREE